MQEINENSEKNSDEDDAFQETEWMDFAEGYYSRMQKKVNLIFKKKKKKISHAVDSLKALFFASSYAFIVFSPSSVAVSVSISVLQPVQVLFTKHLQLQEPCLPLPRLRPVLLCADTLLTVRLHRPPQGCEEAHAVLPRQTPCVKHPDTAAEGNIFTHPSWKREVSVSKMCVSHIFYLCNEEAHYSEAHGEFGRAVHRLQVAPSGEFICQSVLLQDVQGEHWNSRPNVASHAHRAITLYSKHTSAGSDL